MMTEGPRHDDGRPARAKRSLASRIVWVISILVVLAPGSFPQALRRHSNHEVPRAFGRDRETVKERGRSPQAATTTASPRARCDT
jgi:hypothetical protein